MRVRTRYNYVLYSRGVGEEKMNERNVEMAICVSAEHFQTVSYKKCVLLLAEISDLVSGGVR